jgi:ABC-type multidrug transport system fused ATPase/permease subunit
MDTVRNLTNRKTIIIIAHRLSTVRSCDQLFLLEEGRITASGTYDQLLNAHQNFRQMAQYEHLGNNSPLCPP